MKTVLEEFCDMWVNQMPEEGDSSTIEVDWYEISGILSELIEKDKQIKNNVVLADVVEQSEQLPNRNCLSCGENLRTGHKSWCGKIHKG